MSKVRIGIIGMGNMGSNHARSLLAGKVSGAELTAACDTKKPKMDFLGDVPFFDTPEGLFDAGLVDGVIVATPHYAHTTLGIEALNRGLHLLVEKPISVHKADCERLIAAHTNKDLVFAAMFNQRTDPCYIKVRKLIQDGELGELRRVNWIITNWFRSNAYYESSDWRATWEGEGGGVLLNQCPHNLDLLQWMCGMPKSIQAHCAIGKYHDIEVEDDVTAFLEYANGATGVFITSTGEAPGTNRLEIVGDRGRLVVEHGKIHFDRNEVPMDEFCRTSDKLFAGPARWSVDIPVPGDSPQHLGIMRNFTDAIAAGAPLIAPAEEGIHSVEMATAMLYSSFTGKTVELPLDGVAYEAHLKKLIRESTFEKKVVEQTAEDMSKSF